ncbi:MAG TPA: hypothetical protein VFX60_18000 [Micromonospora sp.]|nr:hypothetical protein [Micromonospora sp.]
MPGRSRATAAPVIESAIRVGIPYLDVTSEFEVVTDIFAGSHCYATCATRTRPPTRPRSSTHTLMSCVGSTGAGRRF